ncbi:hypothetical protein AB0756_39625 [Tolypothrix campylonemoides VB511288_2]|uniref:CopG family transcriptional regulator n=3 Tax=Nostocales TaxID=1161 RepID=A0A0C1QVT8_9CYAN
MTHKYQNTGLGTTDHQRPIAAKFPPHIDAILRSIPNRSDYVRKAVIKQLIEDGLLPNDQ